MTELSYHYPPYTPQEMDEFFQSWFVEFNKQNPEGAEEFVRNIVEGEPDGEETS